MKGIRLIYLSLVGLLVLPIFALWVAAAYLIVASVLAEFGIRLILLDT